MNYSNDLSILVLSCDKYSDLWNDFFNLKEKYWSDCPYYTYLATDSKNYIRSGVKVIHFGDIHLWTVCARMALSYISTQYVALFLEDAFFYKEVDTSIIENNLAVMRKYEIDFLTLERNRMGEFTQPEDQIEPHIWKIHCHQKYGIDTSAAIWNKDFLLKELKKADLNAWMFEVSKNREAASLVGLQGRIFFDDRQPFNISPIEIVREGKITPNSIRFYKKLGYRINTDSRPVMSELRLLYYKLKSFVSRRKYLYLILRNVAKVIGVKSYNNS